MKALLIGLGVVIFVGFVIFAAGSFSGQQEAKAAKAETREIQKQIDEDAKTAEDLATAVEEKEAAEEELAKQVERNERLREEIKELKQQVKAKEPPPLIDASPPPPSGPTDLPIPDHIPGGGDDDINIPGWLCPTRFC